MIDVISIAAAMSQKSCFTASVVVRWQQYYRPGGPATWLAASPWGPQSDTKQVNQIQQALWLAVTPRGPQSVTKQVNKLQQALWLAVTPRGPQSITKQVN